MPIIAALRAAISTADRPTIPPTNESTDKWSYAAHFTAKQSAYSTADLAAILLANSFASK